MYGQMTAGSWIYIGTQGILQGTYETFAAAGRHALRQRRSRGPLRAHRRARRHGRRAAARRDDGGRGVPRRRGRSARASRRRLETRYLDERRRRSRRRARAASRRAKQEKRAAVDRLCRQRGRRLPRARAARRRPRSRHRSDVSAHDPLNGYIPRGLLARGRARSCARSDPQALRRGAPCESMARARARRCSRCRSAGAHVFDYGNNIRAMRAVDGGCRGRVRLPRLRAGVHPPALLRGQGAVPLGRALGRSGGHRASPTRRCSSCARTTPHLARWIDARARDACRFQGLPARICWLGYGERAKVGAAFNELVATRQGEGADRHRPRSPRLRLGRVAEPRDRRR